MSKKHVSNQQRLGYDPCAPKNTFNYWQSADFNSLLFRSYHDLIVNLALARFEWKNLPPTCDERFLELCLVTNGQATICTPRKGKHAGDWFSTQAAYGGFINVYDNPTEWDSFGNGGWRIKCDSRNAVMIFDNLARAPMIPLLDYFARELTDLAIAKRLNRQHQKVPFIFTGTQDQAMDLLNVWKQIDGGEPAILGTDTLSGLKPEVFKTDVPYLGEEMDASEQNVWHKIYTFLGIENMPFKAERQIEDEVNSAQMPAEMMKMAPLIARRDACRKLNSRFERFIEKPIEVVWRNDNVSDNNEFMTNVKEVLTNAAAD